MLWFLHESPICSTRISPEKSGLFLLPGLKTLTMTVPTVAKTMRQAVTTQTVAMVGISSSLVIIKIWSFVLQNGVWFEALSRTAHMNEKKSACMSFRKDQHWSASQMENNCGLGKAGAAKILPDALARHAEDVCRIASVTNVHPGFRCYYMFLCFLFLLSLLSILPLP